MKTIIPSLDSKRFPPISPASRQLRLLYATVIGILLSATSLTLVNAQDQHDHHSHGEMKKPEAPKIFLDKSPRVVEYQLKRLDNQRLLMVERETSDAKYIPVYSAILIRVGMTAQYREEALLALAELKEADPFTILIDGISKLDPKKLDDRKTSAQLIQMSLNRMPSELLAAADTLKDASISSKEMVRIFAFAALLTAEQGDLCFSLATKSDDALASLLNAFEFATDSGEKNKQMPAVINALRSNDNLLIKNAAIRSLRFMTKDSEQRFLILAELFGNDALRNEATKALLTIPLEKRPDRPVEQLASKLVRFAEETPAADRTSDNFVDAMQLADQLLSALPTDIARALRGRLDAVTVRMIRIRTVEEEMRYDVPYFVVQAGKPVQIVLENHDLMPHNLVISEPGTLKEVAQAGLQAGPSGGTGGLAYVPDSRKVLFATGPVPSDSQERLTFEAPDEPGEYPYVCTFPQHWYRMYGVMVVVNDLEAWLKAPVEPANPVGNNRSFVQSWTVRDLENELDAGLKGRSLEIGKRLFNEASCLGCHRLNNEGGEIGPDLSRVVAKWKGNRRELLREVLEPSHRVDDAYQMQKVLTVDGQTFTGIKIAEDDEKVLLMASPEAKEPTSIPQDDIEAMVPSAISMMPKALLDQYTKDEIFELLSYIEKSQQTE